MKRWEYKVVQVSFGPQEQTEKELNEFGENGWEVCTRPYSNYLILKREK